MNRRVLLTGASGFIGRHCIPFLHAQGYEVHAVSTRRPSNFPDSVIWHSVDLLHPTSVLRLMEEVQPSHLLHLAWYTQPGVYWTAVENLHWVQASLHLIETFHHCGGQRMVLAGSCAEYDWTTGICSEQVTPLQPATLYGSCKHALSTMTEAFCKQVSLSAAWGRLFFLYGPHEAPERLIPSVILSLLNHQTAHCTAGTQVRDFLHVEDAASAFVSLLSSELTGPVNIASGQGVAVKDIITGIAELLKKPQRVALGSLPLRENDPPLLMADTRRLRDELGWKPRYDLSSGLQQTLTWWKEQARTQVPA